MKNPTFKGGSSQNIDIERGLSKKEEDGGGGGGAWTSCRLKGGLGKKVGVLFLRGGLIPDAHYACTRMEEGNKTIFLIQ